MIKPFDSPTKPKKLSDIVADALTAQYKDRMLLDVSKTQYAVNMAWRGFRQYLWKKVLNWFCPSLLRDANVGTSLKRLLYENDDVRKRLGLVLDETGKVKSSPGIVKYRMTDESETNTEESESYEDSETGSDESEDPKESGKTKRKPNLDDLIGK